MPRAEAPDTPSTSRTDARIAGAVALVTALVYLPSALTNGWVFDDFRFVVENPHVTSPESWLAFFTDPRTLDPGDPEDVFRPLRTLEFAMGHALFGASPAAFHLHSLAWHALGAALTFVLLARLVGARVPALLGALLWSLHPAQVEAVAWVSSRSDVAMGACTLSSLVLALRSRGRDAAFWGSIALGAVAMLYKETAVVLPLLVFALRLWHPARGPRGSIAGAARAAWPWAAVSAAYLLYRSAVLAGAWTHTPGRVLGDSTAGTFATMFRGFGQYLGTALLPARQAVDWYLPESTSLADPAALGWFAVHAGLIGTAVRWRAARPGIAAAISLFYLPLVPVANWPFSLGIPTAERFLYVSLIGVAVAFALGAQRLPRSALAAPFVIVACLGALTVRRAAVWDLDRLWDDAVATHDTPRGHSAIAIRRFRAAREILRAARTDEDVAKSRSLLREALHHGDRAIALWIRIDGTELPRRRDVFELDNNLATACLLLGEPGHALVHAERAARHARRAADHGDETYWQPDRNAAIALETLDRGPRALRAAQRALAGGAPRDEPMRGLLWAIAERCDAEGAHGLAMEAWREGLLDAPAEAWAPFREKLARRRSARIAATRLLESETDDGRRARLAISLARYGATDEADRCHSDPGSVHPDLVVPWIRARHEMRATPDGWRRARELYEALDSSAPEVLERIRRCDEALGDADALLRLTGGCPALR
jgi:tetratricopeptide (TPR) repeat protein